MSCFFSNLDESVVQFIDSSINVTDKKGSNQIPLYVRVSLGNEIKSRDRSKILPAVTNINCKSNILSLISEVKSIIACANKQIVDDGATKEIYVRSGDPSLLLPLVIKNINRRLELQSLDGVK